MDRCRGYFREFVESVGSRGAIAWSGGGAIVKSAPRHLREVFGT